MQFDIDKFYKDTFRLLRGIGVRRSDAVKGRLDGTFLVIDAENEKTGLRKEVLLTKEQIRIVKQLHRRRDNSQGSVDTLMQSLSSTFRICCQKIGIYEESKTTLHCLRHTFAVREYIKTKDIFRVCQLLHHSSVVTTEKYARININRLEQDFPNLSVDQNSSKIRVLDTHKVVTPLINNRVSRLYN